MHKTRLEAFSDGVIAIIITIMVLELKVPHEDNIQALVALLPVFLSYVLSFVYVGIYWNNHHHMLSAVDKINGKALWGNLHLLFWLSLIPFTTEWMGENNFTKWPVLLYGSILFMNSVAYFILAKTLIGQAGKNSKLAKAFGKDWKGKSSVLLYVIAVGFSFANTKISLAIYTGIAIMWLVPDKRIEHEVLDQNQPKKVEG
ncbi:MAG: TMEM175 family protein [Mucilaginibacter sp.]|uniref:TMEM175 family protein n=1 Tax=Mucilaginibacter sp. TaxID=1882438 RepID=UPI0034E61544